MIVEKEVTVRWNPTNREHYESVGYIFNSWKESFVVSINNIHPNSTLDVHVKCDECGQIMIRKYYNTIKMRVKNNRTIDLCRKCANMWNASLIKEKQKNSELTSGSSGYWMFFENRKQALLNYIDKHGHLNNMHKYDNNLYGAINKYDGGLKAICDNLGIDWSIVKNNTPRGFYNNFENIQKKIELFISENDRFPTQKELRVNYKIQDRNIQRHGGMNEIKKKISYDSKNDLLDSNGYYNKSLLEYQTAEFLIKNNVFYKRETLPFPSRQIKCDFEIETVDGRIFFVEVWGYSQNDTGNIAKRYSIKRQEKVELYNLHKMNLIELEYDAMNRLALDKLNQYFVDKFSDVISSKTMALESKYLLHPQSVSDDKIAEILLSVNNNSGILPTYSIAKESSSDKFIREAVRRYGSYQEFADHFGLSFAVNRHEWNDDTVNEFMFTLVQKGLPITRKNIENQKAGGLFIYIRKTDKNSLADRKLDFYEKFIDDIDAIPSYDLSFLEKIAHCEDKRRTKKIKPEDSIRAISILNKYNSKIKHNAV